MSDSIERTGDDIDAQPTPIGDLDPANTQNEDKPLLTTPEQAALAIPLGLQVDDLHNSNVPLLFKYIPDPQKALEAAYQSILSNLYHAPMKNGQPLFTPSLPETKSVSLIIADFEGVAYTTDVGDGNKKIYISSGYIGHCACLDDPAHEINGVLTHELVHCFQHTHPPGSDSSQPPGGLTEGIADFVRLRAGLGAAHWKRPSTSADAPDRWDAGYENTAYFLDWIENVRGEGTISWMNQRLYTDGYGDQGLEFWNYLLGASVEQVYAEYRQHLNSMVTPQASIPVPDAGDVSHEVPIASPSKPVNTSLAPSHPTKTEENGYDQRADTRKDQGKLQTIRGRIRRLKALSVDACRAFGRR